MPISEIRLKTIEISVAYSTVFTDENDSSQFCLDGVPSVFALDVWASFWDITVTAQKGCHATVSAAIDDSSSPTLIAPDERRRWTFILLFPPMSFSLEAGNSSLPSFDRFGGRKATTARFQCGFGKAQIGNTSHRLIVKVTHDRFRENDTDSKNSEAPIAHSHFQSLFLLFMDPTIQCFLSNSRPYLVMSLLTFCDQFTSVGMRTAFHLPFTQSSFHCVPFSISVTNARLKNSQSQHKSSNIVYISSKAVHNPKYTQAHPHCRTRLSSHLGGGQSGTACSDAPSK
jgi:hypothetical protein